MQEQEDIVQAFSDWEQSTFSMGLLNTIIFAAIVAVIVFVAIKLVNKAVNKGIKGNAVFLRRLLDVIIIVVAGIAVLTTITPLKEFGASLLASSGIAAVVVGLAAQEALGNVFSGFSIGISKPFEIGEYIEIVELQVNGIVEEVGLCHTVVRDLDNKRIVVPNSVINKEVVLVSKGMDINCNHLIIGISYDSDIEKAISIIEEEASGHPLVLDQRTEEQKKCGEHKIRVRVENFGDFAVELNALVWTKDVVTGYYVLSDIRKAVKKRFDEENIEIPYPYHNIIMKNDKSIIN